MLSLLNVSTDYMSEVPLRVRFMQLTVLEDE